MRNFNEIYTDKLNESNKYREEQIASEYGMILKALMEDNNVVSFDTISEDNMKSFKSKINECFDINHGITEFGKEYLSRREMFLTESSTNNERKAFFKKRITDILNKKMFADVIKDDVYESFNDIYESVNASKFSDALPIEDVESCIYECVVEHIKNTLVESIKNEIDLG